MLDDRAARTWDRHAGSPWANADTSRFLERLHRPNFPHVFPPPLFSQDVEDRVAAVGTALAGLVTEMPHRVFGEDVDAWTEFLGVAPRHRALLARAHRVPHLRRAATAFCRPDLVWTREGVTAVEVNVSAPMGGMNTHDPYVDAFRDSEHHALLAAAGVGVRAPVMASAWLAAFAGLLRGAPRPGRHVFEAVADPADIDSGRRFFVDMLTAAGYRVSCGLITELDVRPSGVFHAGERVDAVFTMYTWDEAARFVPADLTTALIDADGEGVVDFVGAPASALYDNKGNLELLTAAPFRAHLSATERELVDRHVPETFRLTTGSVDRAIALRTDLVCKPASAYGGKGIALGAEVAPSEWAAAVRERADADEPYVCQRRVTPAAAYRSPSQGGDVEVCFGPLIFGGRYAGTFLRQVPASRSAVINVAAGARAAAMLVAT